MEVYMESERCIFVRRNNESIQESILMIEFLWEMIFYTQRIIYIKNPEKFQKIIQNLEHLEKFIAFISFGITRDENK